MSYFTIDQVMKFTILMKNNISFNLLTITKFTIKLINTISNTISDSEIEFNERMNQKCDLLAQIVSQVHQLNRELFRVRDWWSHRGGGGALIRSGDYSGLSDKVVGLQPNFDEGGLIVVCTNYHMGLDHFINLVALLLSQKGVFIVSYLYTIINGYLPIGHQGLVGDKS